MSAWGWVKALLHSVYRLPQADLAPDLVEQPPRNA
jgi:hypothetical protein